MFEAISQACQVLVAISQFRVMLVVVSQVNWTVLSSVKSVESIGLYVAISQVWQVNWIVSGCQSSKDHVSGHQSSQHHVSSHQLSPLDRVSGYQSSPVAVSQVRQVNWTAKVAVSQVRIVLVDVSQVRIMLVTISEV